MNPLSAVLASGAMAMLWPVSDERQSSEDEAMNAAVLARVGGTVTDVKPWLSGWDERSPDELIALAATHRIDSIVVAFEEAIGMKAYRQGAGALSEAEADVLAIEGLEREVNNGGYLQCL